VRLTWWEYCVARALAQRIKETSLDEHGLENLKVLRAAAERYEAREKGLVLSPARTKVKPRLPERLQQSKTAWKPGGQMRQHKSTWALSPEEKDMTQAALGRRLE